MDSAPLAAPATHALRRRQSVGVIRWLVGVAVGITGLANMASIFLPHLRLDLLLDSWPLDLEMETSLRSLTVVVGFLLIMLSRGLIRGKRTAWELTVVLLVLGIITHALHGGWVLATWTAMLACVLVLSARAHFQARSDPPSVRRGYAALLGGLALVFLYTAGGILWLRSQFEPVVRLRGLLRATLHAMAWTDHLRGIPDTPQVQFFLNAVPWLSICALAYGVFQLLRPVAKSLLPAPHEREIVKQLIAQWGTSTISYIALSKEKSYFFHSSGQAGLAYRLVGNVAVVAGDPIGPEVLLADVLAEFSTYCRRQDWHMVFWQVAHSRLPLYTARGLQTMKIGEDAVVDLPSFTLAGGPMQHLRSMCRRAEKAGVAVRFFEGQVDDPELARQMEAIHAAWLAERGGVEMGFSMGRFGERLDLETVYAVAVDATSRVHAFVNFVPIYGRHGWALDLMRRDAQAKLGVMELLLANSIERFKARGDQMLSLGLAPLSNTTNEPASNVEQLCHFFSSRFGGLARAESLYNFKKKFHPRWEPRYLIYPNTVTLPRVGLALVVVHLSLRWFPWLRQGVRRQASSQRLEAADGVG
jgi:phosphatidylglycerol lysyltransferase